ncbi:hypothetical protein N7495_002838 [Penicillium taxi]|uniref:uncharacterized protein n=1 Tax=Penicillium taxi TaxID=168475 RepID=UPI002545B6EF|nr:uncharacterized protein N7495_002838 [Penicillium taxi]KAJ5902310.1 hypothetical protein N7495_002838 [Penicillium taxi]
MIKIIIPSKPPAELTIVSREDGAHTFATRQLIAPGDYDIFPAEGSTIKLIDKVRERRIPSGNNTGATPRLKAFYKAVRKRDQIGAHSAYINSMQNGSCMRSDLHAAFNDNDISINPDDGYKIYEFTNNEDGIDGRVLPLFCRTRVDPNAVSNDLLRWHWQQTLLKNLKGATEPIWEFDFQIAERMEAELLAHFHEYVSDDPEAEGRREAEHFARHHEYVDDESDF